MKLTDLNGCEIEITNLKEAIKIANAIQGIATKTKAFQSLTKDKKPIRRTYTGNSRQSKNEQITIKIS